MKDQIRLLKELPLNEEIDLIIGNYEPEIFYQRVEGLEQEKEGQARCVKCYELRLEKTAQKAVELGFPYFTTTLTISPHKNSETINELGGKIASAYNINYLFSDFKKKDGFRHSVLLSKRYRLYRQNYCGCIFSLQDSSGFHTQDT